jgi:aldehyde dehydrogenase (NAD+)
MTIAKEEIFGPVMSVIKFKTIEEVIEKANDSEFGLASGVCTTNIESAIEISNALKSGQVYVNCWGPQGPTAPFGGYKQSGIGRELGTEGLKPYLETKTVIIKRKEGSLP